MTVRYRRLSDLVELAVMLQTSTMGITLDQIVERFEVSRRTAERMLAALRVTFVDIEATFRDGRKYWRLALLNRSGALKLPAEIAQLAARVERLTAEINDVRAAGAMNHAILDDALTNSAVGIFILDADFRVVWTNEALRRYFGVTQDEIHGRDKRELIRSRIRDIILDGEEFERRVLGTYADNTYVERFECCVVAAPGRDGRWLRHWSQPIRSGIYAGGRVEHYVDLSEHPSWVDEFVPQVVDGSGRPSRQTRAHTASVAEQIPSIRDPLANLMAAAERLRADALDLSNAIDQIVRSDSQISALVEEGVSRAHAENEE